MDSFELFCVIAVGVAVGVVVGRLVLSALIWIAIKIVEWVHF